jgi:hypothetical protein
MMHVIRPWRLVGALLLGIFLTAGHPIESAAQQANQNETEEWETRVFEIEHAGRDEVNRILDMFEARWTFDERLKTLLVRSPGNIMPAIAQVVERFDVAAPRTPSVELTMHVLLASGEEREDLLPSPLSDVVDQLRGVFPYRSFRLLETAVARGVDREQLSIQGVLPLQIEGVRHPAYMMRGTLYVTPGTDDARVVRFENFIFQSSVRIGGEQHDIQIMTTIEIAEGQQAVVGKASVADNALILVMSTRLID